MPIKPAPIYRPLFQEAWRLTWERKSLWVFGLLAALLSTGGVVELAWRAFRRVETSSNVLVDLLHGSIFGYANFSTWIQQLQALREWQLPTIVAGIVACILFAIGAAIVSQGALMAAVREDEELSLEESAKEGRRHAWDIFVLNLIAKLVLAVLMTATTLPLVLVATENLRAEALLTLSILIVFFPCVMAIQTVFMFALSGIVRDQEHALNAIAMGAKTFARHAFACLEFAAAQFLLVFAALFAGITLLVILILPFSVFFLLAILSGAPLLFLFSYALGSVIVFTLFFTLIGGTTVFQYTSWWLFYERAMHRPGRPTLRAKLSRLWARR